jgi:XTP/dITP diphosphohydrolase
VPGGSGERRRLVVATHSAHKLRELRELLDLEHTDLVSLDDLGIADEPVEDGLTFETNARIKARFAARRTGLPALADDSGIEVDALGGRPGVQTRRYAGPDATDPENNAKLLLELAGVAGPARAARYVCVLALAIPATGARPGDRALAELVARRGTTRGRIAVESSGTAGFGYDPIFEPSIEPPGGRTFGRYSPEEKHRISHRARAARRMRTVLAARGF